MSISSPALSALLALCAAMPAQQSQRPATSPAPIATSPQPYTGGAGVLWRHSFRQPGAAAARLLLSVDLGPGDALVLRDGSGVEQHRYHGAGPGAAGAATDPIDVDGSPVSFAFLSGPVSGDTVMLELVGASGGGGVSVHRVAWSDAPITAAGTAGGCDLDVVVPDGFADVAGSTSTSFPWNRTSPIRVMYSCGRAAVGFERTVRIRGVRFRPPVGSATAPVDYDLRLDVSTGRTPASSMDATFDANHGADRVTVFDGLLSHPGSIPTTTLDEFPLEVTFDTPFEWDPRCGPLVLDYRMFGASTIAGATFDATTTLGDIGRIAHTTDANAAVATFSGGSTQGAALIVDLCLEADVVPSANDATEANSSSAYPWGRTSPIRVQYAHAPSDMDFVGRHEISALSFRTNNGVAFPGNSYDMIVSMSTGPVPASAIGSIFADNHGDDLTVVFDGEHIADPAPAASVAPGAFALTLPLQTPFEYNPADGPLIIDIQLRTGAASTLSWDGVNGGAGYRVYNTLSSSATAGSVQNFGLVVGLSAEPIPTLPESSDSTDGGTTTSYPWSVAGTEQRVMYQYSPGAVATDRPLYIQHMSWRPAGAAGFGPATYTCTIDLSTSSVAAGAMTPAFNNNHGGDRARVFEGAFTVPYLADNSDRSRYPITVKLDQPFYYDPANGPLIVDIRMLDTAGFPGNATGSFTGTGWRFAHLSNADSNIADWPTSGNAQAFGLDLRLDGDGCNATSINYGVACAGSNGLSRCVNLGLPTLPNADFAIGLKDGPPLSFGVLIVALTELNVPLDFLGAPGCFGLTGGEIGTAAAPTDANGWTQVGIPLPDVGASVGFEFRTQWASLDAVNPLGIVFSDAQVHTTCY